MLTKKRIKKGVILVEIIVNAIDEYCLLLLHFVYFTCLAHFFRSTLVDRRVYFRLLLSTLHASVSYFLGTANTKQSRLLGTWRLWHFST